MLYPFIGLCSWRALFRVVYAGANAAGQNGELVSAHVIPRPEETVLETFLK